MGKRSDFVRNKHDVYDTNDPTPVAALLPHLKPRTRFVEPCAGEGALIRHLVAAGHECVGAFDIEPRGEYQHFAAGGPSPIQKMDALKLDVSKLSFQPDEIISNTPWTPEILLPMILRFYWQRPTWLLLSADFGYNGYARPYMPICSKIVAAGRVRWMLGKPEDKGDGPKDNAAWYRFEARQRPEFYGKR